MPKSNLIRITEKQNGRFRIDADRSCMEVLVACVRLSIGGGEFSDQDQHPEHIVAAAKRVLKAIDRNW